MVHFAVDDACIKFCTKLAGKDSWFLPFDKGYKDGAGNPPNPNGMMTDYLWKDILTKAKLTRIIENYAQVILVSKLFYDRCQLFPVQCYLLQDAGGLFGGNAVKVFFARRDDQSAHVKCSRTDE